MNKLRMYSYLNIQYIIQYIVISFQPRINKLIILLLITRYTN